MLDRESQRLDLQEGRLAEQTVEVEAQGMCGQFGVEASAQTPEGMGMVDFDVELIGKLGIQRFNHLANRVEKALASPWQLLLLIAARNGFEFNPVLLPQVGSFGCTDIGFIAQDLQVGVFNQQLKADFQVVFIGRRKFKIENDAIHGNQQV